VGTIVAFTPTGLVTVRAAGEEFPPEGSAVRLAGAGLEGRVVRLFGPVARPYAVVRPRRVPSPVDGAAMLGGEVYRA
jgi:rRNA processing protein Gar1